MHSRFLSRDVWTTCGIQATYINTKHRFSFPVLNTNYHIKKVGAISRLKNITILLNLRRTSTNYKQFKENSVLSGVIPYRTVLVRLSPLPVYMGKTCPGQKSRSSSWATLVEPTFPSFPHNIWRAIYMRNKKMAPLKAGHLAGLVTWLAWSPG